MPGYRYRLGDEVHDLTTRTLVMGILNRTPDSFYDRGQYWDLDTFYARAARLVADAGYDVLVANGTESDPSNVRYFSAYWPLFEMGRSNNQATDCGRKPASAVPIKLIA